MTGVKGKGKERRIGGLLTERQVEILNLRRGGLTQEETAGRLGISRQDVSILEKRSLRNINMAAETLQMAQNIGVLKRTRINPGRHILEVAKCVFDFADSEGIRIRTNALGIMTLVQAAASSSTENGIVRVSIEAIILPDGRVIVNAVE